MDALEFSEGIAAKKAGKKFKECPYLFGKVNVSQEEFEKQFRQKLNLWTKGWAMSEEQGEGK